MRSSRSRYRHSRMVYVRPYRRFRFGQWEDVCSHYRSHPGQLAFDFF